MNTKRRQTFSGATIFPNSPHSVKIPSDIVKDRNDNGKLNVSVLNFFLYVFVGFLVFCLWKKMCYSFSGSVGISVALLKGMANVLPNVSRNGR